MTDQEWLSKATVFDLGMCKVYHRPVEIKARVQIDGSTKWCISMQEWVLAKDGEFYVEPLPSSITPYYLDLTRFDSRDEAYRFWVTSVTVRKPLYI